MQVLHNYTMNGLTILTKYNARVYRYSKHKGWVVSVGSNISILCRRVTKNA